MTVPEARELEAAAAANLALPSGPPLLVPLEVVAPAPVRERLSRLGRTEDIRLSPSRRRLAIACYAIDRIAVADVELSATEVRLTRLELLASPAVRQPHGLDFVDDDTLVVASREGGLAVLPIPAGDVPPTAWDVTPTAVHAASGHDDSPGSVAVATADGGGHELLVCVNWTHTLKRHRLHAGTLSPPDVAARRWLDVPDGVAISPDERWVAVSNHFSHSVFVYERHSLGEGAEPVAILRGATYPHGLRFSADARRLVVADAGAPHVHVFAAAEGGWSGASYPAATVAVFDDATYRRGRHTPQEGGPKGLELDARTNVMLVTCEETPFLCFDVGAVVDDPGSVGPDADALVRYELHAIAAVDDATPLARIAREQAGASEHAALLEAELAAIKATRAWRLLEPARAASGGVRRRVRR